MAPHAESGRDGPLSIEIRILHPGDDRILMNVAPGVFDNPIDPELTAEFLADHRHHIAVAIDEGQVVGFASAVHYIHPDKAPELWINEVGVAPAYHRRGIGKAVLRALLDKGKTLRCTNAWVLTNRDNPAAIALYCSAGGSEGIGEGGVDKQMVGYSFKLNEI